MRSILWGLAAARGRTLQSWSRLLVGFVRKSRHDVLVVGGWVALLQAARWLVRVEIRSNNAHSDWLPGSHEGSHAKDFRKALLFLCYRDPKLFAIYSVLQSNNVTENGMRAPAHVKCAKRDLDMSRCKLDCIRVVLF